MRPRDLLPLVLLSGAALFVGSQIMARPDRPPAPVVTSEASAGSPPSVVAQGEAAPVGEMAAGSSAPAPARDDAAVQVMLRDGAPGTYIVDILSQQQRRLLRWPERQAEPLRVWIARTSGVGNWNPEYPLAAERAFAEWRAAGFPIDFHFVHDSASAQIRIGWTEKFTEADSQQIGLARKQYDKNGWLLAAEIRLATHSARGRSLSPQLITGVARHEVGHALGLGHSSNRSDVMYPEAYTTDISAADRATLHLLYKLPPGVMP